MMLGELTEIGEKVILVDLSSEEGIYKPGYPEGTICEIVNYPLVENGVDDYSRSKGLKPGMYENRCWARIRMPDGRIMNMGFFHLTAYDCNKYGERFHEFRRMQETDKEWFWNIQIPHYREELPKTEFQIGDHVKIIDRDGHYRSYMGTDTFTITGIDYTKLWSQIHEGMERGQFYQVEACPRTNSTVFLGMDDKLEYVDVV